MSHDRWERSDAEEGEWETAVNVKKINRAVRRERKEAEAAQAATVGNEPEHFDAEAARRAAQASFYGATKQKQRKAGGKKGAAELDFEEAGWSGGGGPNQKVKKSKKAKEAVPQYNTADEIASALVDLISRLPPTVSGASTTLASLGDKLATRTKKKWNAAYKPIYGTMRKFLEERPHLFHVNGEEVALAAAAAHGKMNSAAGKSAAKKPTKATSTSASNGQQQSSEEESDDDDDDEEAATGVGSSRKSTTKSVKADASPVVTALAVLGLAAAGLAAWYFITEQHKA